MRVHWINLERNSPNYYQLVVWRVNIAKYRLVSSFDSNLCSYYQNYKRFVSSVMKADYNETFGTYANVTAKSKN